MLQRSHDTTVDLDLELARRTSNENPVYYVQYAHARIASILRKAGEGAEDARPGARTARALPVEPAERGPDQAPLRAPRRGRRGRRDGGPRTGSAPTRPRSAPDFHAFYRDCQVVGAEGDGVEEARLAICLLTKRTIARTLGLLGISAPERM